MRNSAVAHKASRRSWAAPSPEGAPAHSGYVFPVGGTEDDFRLEISRLPAEATTWTNWFSDKRIGSSYTIIYLLCNNISELTINHPDRLGFG